MSRLSRRALSRTIVPLALPIVFLLAGCGGGASSGDKRPAESAQKTDAAAPAATPAGEARWDAFGAPVSEAAPVMAAAVLAAPDQYTGRTIVVEGPVAEVCQVKGCWMTMQAADASMRIRFKDYGFFVPKDCAGRTARIEGVLSVAMTPVEEARHYLEDAGKHDEAQKITEPVKSVTFMASGVRLKA